MLYPFFDVIPKSKIPSIHYKMTETTDLKWISGREAGLRLINGLRQLVDRWCRASVVVTLTMSRAGGGKQSELERPELREWAWERWASKMRWEWAWERWLQRWDESEWERWLQRWDESEWERERKRGTVERPELKRVMSFREMSFRVNERKRGMVW